MYPPPSYIFPLSAKKSKIGGKARGLKFLDDQNLNVPETYVCTIDAYKRWIDSDDKILKELRCELEQIIKKDKYYIVRSSADLEDSTYTSYAGQLNSIPSIKGVDEILKGIVKVWDSASSINIEEYSTRKGIKDKIQVAVLIQEMIRPDFSGVVFTRNPLNGLEEVIIEAVSGSSDKILQEGHDPYRWVYRWGSFREKPINSTIDENIIKKVAITSKTLEKKYKFPIDLEWLFSDNKLWWIQLREITTIDEFDFYSNTISSEQLPGLITPLVWSINIPLVCGAWIRLLEEMVGKTNLRPSDMAGQFYFRAYYNMSAIGRVFEKFGIQRDSLEIMMGHGGSKGAGLNFRPPLKLLPRILLFIIQKSYYEGKLRSHIKESERVIHEYNDKKLTSLNEVILFIDQLFNYLQKAAYFVIVSQLLHTIFHQMIKKRILKKGLEISEVNLESDISSINPSTSIRDLNMYLIKSEKVYSSSDDITKSDVFKQKYEVFMENFGHLSDSGNDFSKPTWAETPDHVLNLIKLHHEFQVGLGKKSNNEIKNWWLYKKVIKLHELREKISFNYTKGYGIFRKYFLFIGEKFVERGIINDKSDIFYLNYDEIKDIISSYSRQNRMDEIENIKIEMEKMQEIHPPSEIYGDELPPLFDKRLSLSEYEGIPASKGYFKGKTRHVKKIEDFSKIVPGEIIIIPYSDISWLPIFTRAGAIISTSGGILSHAAVIAREYNIPAIVGVKNAYNIPEGIIVLIDGYKGTITLVEENEDNN
jgi:pyruvate,water dikinase